MSHRFFLDSRPANSTVVLDGKQAHHAIHVMRFQVGDTIVLFDGSGLEYHAIIEELSKKKLHLAIQRTVAKPGASDTCVELAVALPKGDRQKFLVEKLVELGVSKLIPLKTVRSVAVANDKVIQRLEKQVIEASKQCGRNTLMAIEHEAPLPDLPRVLTPGGLRLIADPYDGKPIGSLSIKQRDTVAVAIGPEGGFDESENQLAKEMGFAPVQVGSAILRVETAAIAIAAILGAGKRTSAVETSTET